MTNLVYPSFSKRDNKHAMAQSKALNGNLKPENHELDHYGLDRRQQYHGINLLILIEEVAVIQSENNTISYHSKKSNTIL